MQPQGSKLSVDASLLVWTRAAHVSLDTKTPHDAFRDSGWVLGVSKNQWPEHRLQMGGLTLQGHPQHTAKSSRAARHGTASTPKVPDLEDLKLVAVEWLRGKLAAAGSDHQRSWWTPGPCSGLRLR